jgi:hypothetical protein
MFLVILYSGSSVFASETRVFINPNLLNFILTDSSFVSEEVSFKRYKLFLYKDFSKLVSLSTSEKHRADKIYTTWPISPENVHFTYCRLLEILIPCAWKIKLLDWVITHQWILQNANDFWISSILTFTPWEVPIFF